MLSRRTIFLAVCFCTAVLVCWRFWPPGFASVLAQSLGSDRVLLASDGTPLQTLRVDFNRKRMAWVSLDGFSPNLIEAIIQAEDQRFHRHFGIDPIAVGRAFYAWIRGGRIQGASTITMQVTDLIDLDVLKEGGRIRKRSFAHKLRQALSALLLELRWSKKEILETYLNLIHLRGQQQGVPAFVAKYFSTSTLATNPAQNAVVASLISSPNQRPERLLKKACANFAKLTGSGHGECERVEVAINQLQTDLPYEAPEPELAHHLARRLFLEKPNVGILRSTLNARMQTQVQEILERNIAQLAAKNVQDSAAIVIDNTTGRVLAYVGAIRKSKTPHVDGVIAPRQAGSTLKPLLYARAIESKSVTAASVLLDEPTAIQWSGGVYRPTNYDKTFHGAVSLREALGSSLNVPAVKLVTILGLHDSYRALHDFRISGLKEPDFYGVSMALGAVEVRLDDLANAYRTLANGGSWSPLVVSEELHEDRKSSDLDANVDAKRAQVLSPAASFITASILADPHARAMGFGLSSPLETSFWSAVKTGTSKDYRDNWCVGFSRRYTVGVWVGNFDATAMAKVSGVSGAGPAWLEIMNELHREETSDPPPLAEGVVTRKIRHPWQSQEREEFFVAGTEPTIQEIGVRDSNQVEFLFPTHGTILLHDPKLADDQTALFVRFKGLAPEGSQVFLNGRKLGAATSPFKIDQLTPGRHTLEVRSGEKMSEVVAKVEFSVKS